MEINNVLNELLVNLFKDINDLEERAIQTGEYKSVTTNDMHVIDAIGMGQAKNMSSVAKILDVTMGTLTISVNSLVKKGFVQRVRSEEDRRVVLISLTDSGKKAYEHHRQFHQNMISSATKELTGEEKAVLEKVLTKLNAFLKQI
ncbi:MAG: MarR family transcriptional regulator [Lachnospiraceae bacterium]|nr:MarR family transcriptional regulator [Lachnospiraceae bacterium]